MGRVFLEEHSKGGGALSTDEGVCISIAMDKDTVGFVSTLAIVSRVKLGIRVNKLLQIFLNLALA